MSFTLRPSSPHLLSQKLICFPDSRSIFRQTQHLIVKTYSANIMSTHHQTVEHIVLLNYKPDVDSTTVASMIDELQELASLNLTTHLWVLPLLRCASTSLNFSHIVYARFSSPDDLHIYNYHPEHIRVAKKNQPLIDDAMVVDWIANGIPDPMKAGSMMRVVLLKLKEDLGENEKGKIVEEIISELKTSEQISVGEDISRVMAKGYSIGMIAVFPDLEGVDSDAELASFHKSKVMDFIESEVIGAFVVPLP